MIGHALLHIDHAYNDQLTVVRGSEVGPSDAGCRKANEGGLHTWNGAVGPGVEFGRTGCCGVVGRQPNERLKLCLPREGLGHIAAPRTCSHPVAVPRTLPQQPRWCVCLVFLTPDHRNGSGMSNEHQPTGQSLL